MAILSDSSRRESANARRVAIPQPLCPSCPAGQAIFDDFRDQELLPAYLADADANRALLDRRVICELLGFDVGVYRAVRRLAAKRGPGGQPMPNNAGAQCIPAVSAGVSPPLVLRRRRGCCWM